MIKIYNSQQAYDNAVEPYDDFDEDGVTQEQQQVLSEYDDDIAKLEQQSTDEICQQLLSDDDAIDFILNRVES